VPPPSEALLQPAIDGVFAAFKTHTLVGLSDDHGLVQEADFYAALVRDPRFAREVGNVVVEFGARGQQGVLDRYLAGETVPYTELRKVWTDTVGAIPAAGNMGVAKFLAAVRRVNRALAPDRHIRVWAGEPPMDWSAEKVNHRGMLSFRDSHPAGLIERNILAYGRKALVIYGAYHFVREPVPDPTLFGRIEEKFPGSFFLVLPYTFFHRPAACAPLLIEAGKIWPATAMATVGRAGARDPVTSECATFSYEKATSFVRQPPELRQQGTQVFDGVLFFGPIESLRRSGTLPEYPLDTEYRLEMYRRAKAGGIRLLAWPKGMPLRKADYEADLDAPGYAERLDAMFGKFDRNKDGVVTEDEYAEQIPAGGLPQLALSAESLARLDGTWAGREGTSPVTLFIRKDLKGGLYSADDNKSTLPITEAEINGARLTARLGTADAVLTLNLSGKTLSGTAVRGDTGKPVRVTLTRR
jgi:hypothetical protein